MDVSGVVGNVSGLGLNVTRKLSISCGAAEPHLNRTKIADSPAVIVAVLRSSDCSLIAALAGVITTAGGNLATAINSSAAREQHVGHGDAAVVRKGAQAGILCDRRSAAIVQLLRFWIRLVPEEVNVPEQSSLTPPPRRFSAMMVFFKLTTPLPLSIPPPLPTPERSRSAMLCAIVTLFRFTVPATIRNTPPLRCDCYRKWCCCDGKVPFGLICHHPLCRRRRQRYCP